ncbi:hypothetical protein ERJ75_000054200 [Trypanosoma vivax]|uniref:Uncharacterized protein n=1 Tax=Trypanosoma vivax (strain Y486) TaxID=1055687 RepID=G0TZ90_TRYVY|nr:hypothetical protein TRVL_02395 [Trypanosoma vivax]KAH8620574.1 hypothetical protein ERJ75_000054200 [Trypanosoma vivax]CCC49293.1 conserved hypothetical protein [Trypanosoma vivax Y486]
MSGAESSFSTLVIWGSTGKRVQFTRQDLRMPEDLKERQNYHFFEKQWDAVAGFWMNRVLKEPVLQYATVSEIIECIVNDIERRWDQRKREKALYKKRKRLLDPRGTAAHGVPSPHVLLTNFVSLSEYRRLSAAGELPDLITAVTKKVEEVAKVKVLQHQLLVDEGNDVGNESSGVGDAEVPEKRRRLEDGAEDEATSQKEEAKEQPTSEPSFDDHVALVCTLPNVEKAATAVAELHGSVFDSRAVMCRFYDL